MSTTTKLSFEQFQKLQEEADNATRYELDEGELITIPPSTPRHSIAALRLSRSLAQFVETHSLGAVFIETDFQLAANTIRKPDVAFIARAALKDFDIDRVPIQIAPTLAVEIVSPGNDAHDILKKTRQYMAAGCQAVWLVYPKLRVVEIHDAAGVRYVNEPEAIREDRLFPGLTFSLSLTALFDENPQAVFLT
jgi:Uma2 family endonuclease